LNFDKIQRDEMPSGDADGYYVLVALITATVVLTLATGVGVSLSSMVQWRWSFSSAIVALVRLMN
jgi:hypothetical protein